MDGQAVHSSPPSYGDYPVSRLIAVRAVILVLALFAATIQSVLSSPHEVHTLHYDFIAIGILLGICSLSALWIRLKGVSPTFNTVQLCLDSLLVTGVVYSTGGSLSPFVFLYIPLVMFSTLYFSRRAGALVTSLCIILYWILNLGMKYSFIAPTWYFEPDELSLGSLARQTIGLAGAMALVCIATDFLRRTLEAREKLVRDSTLSLEKLGAQQQSILDSMPDAIVTTDSNGVITSANPAAQALFGKGGDMIGQELDPIARDCLPSFSRQKITSPSFGKPQEFRVSGGNQRGRLLECVEQAINSAGSTNHGILYLFRDVTEQRVLEQQRAVEAEYLQATERSDSVHSGLDGHRSLIGQSLLFKKVIDLVERVASSEATVLLFGESGTGKELVARAIHQLSPRKDEPFVAVNCGAIPESLIESQLFGHKKGAFTGATADHIGYFREAMNGTLFLDEIGELPLSMQAKLLRALQERIVRPVGGNSDIAIDVRIVAATNRNLKRESEAGRFREDLYYRLNVLNITIPPLRKRREDIPLLIRHFLSQGRADNRDVPELASETLRLLVSYHYPGNIRELENIIQRAVVLGGSLILPEHLPDSLHDQQIQPPRTNDSLETQIIELPCDLDSILATTEREYLIAALRKTKGSRKEASELLGLNLRSLRYRIQKFGLDIDGD